MEHVRELTEADLTAVAGGTDPINQAIDDAGREVFGLPKGDINIDPSIDSGA